MSLIEQPPPPPPRPRSAFISDPASAEADCSERPERGRRERSEQRFETAAFSKRPSRMEKGLILTRRRSAWGGGVAHETALRLTAAQLFINTRRLPDREVLHFPRFSSFRRGSSFPDSLRFQGGAGSGAAVVRLCFPFLPMTQSLLWPLTDDQSCDRPS